MQWLCFREGILIGENETSRFWLGVLNELKNRGVEDVLTFSVDGLSGIKKQSKQHSRNLKFKDV